MRPFKEWLARLHVTPAWPFWLGVLLFCLHLPYLVPGGPWARGDFPLVLGQDEATVLYDALRIAEGDTMYRDFFQFQGPVGYYLNSLIFVFTGPSMIAARLVHLVVLSAAAALLALIVSRFAGRLAGVGVALVHACLLVPLWPFVYVHWTAELFVLIALALLTRKSVTPRAEIVAGACLGLSLFTIQSLGIPALVAVVGTVSFSGIAARDWRRALARPGRILLGAAITAILILGYFALRGALSELLYAMFVWPHSNYQLGQGAAGDIYGWGIDQYVKLHHKVDEPWRLLATGGLRLMYFLPFCAVAAAVVVAPRALYRMWKGRADYPASIVVGVSLAVISPLLLGFLRQDATHIAFLSSFGLASAGVLAGLVLVRGRWLPWVVALAFTVVGMGSLLTYSHKTVITWDKSRALGDWREESLKLSAAALMDEILAPDDTIVVGAMAGFYYMHVRRSASPNTYIPGRHFAYYNPEQWAAIADAIIEGRPGAMLFVGNQWQNLLAQRPELAKLYQRQGGILVPATPRPEQ